jgi:hypothetical protein
VHLRRADCRLVLPADGTGVANWANGQFGPWPLYKQHLGKLTLAHTATIYNPRATHKAN